MERNLLVIGATGKTGGHTAELLLQRGHHVRALVRRVDERSERLAGLGAQIVEGDVLDLNSLAEATKGIDALYFTYPIVPGLMDATANVALAAEENGVQAIVNMSQISARRESASNAARQHWVAERVLEHFPAAVTHIRPTFFAQWLINMWDGSGELRFPFADGRHAPIAASDQARVIAAILEDPAPHAGQIYPLHGPVELNHYEIAEKMSKALSRQVTYMPIDLDEFAAILKKRGTSPHMIQHLLAVSVDYRNGIFAGTNDLVKKIGGTGPLDIESFVAQNRAFYDSHTV
ncbi:NAD(P)H-binding protein [Streptomyces sp. 142MFCol3.1]|uniref:NmrA family NAD(P)-binding protein n=2 Tax=Streptomyces sp. 142MFCol3.1 TaxID=1172179 RepID=UPI000402B114|nr:NAD(P)H-binding protein [Streptomyces sp. 142MFCol3.1]